MLEQLEQIYLGEGRPPPPEGYKRLFNTPMGPFPKLVDVALQYKMFKSNIHRRYTNKSEKYKDWYIITDPTPEQNYQAIQNVNALFIAKYEEEDNCSLCNQVDDMIFPEGCWLLKVDHQHGLMDIEDAVIHYCFRRKDYKVTLLDWMGGVRPHLEETK